MERNEAIARLEAIKGINLHELAPKYNVTVVSGTNLVNKGWAGHVIEGVLGLPPNSSKNPDFGSWELKTVPLKTLSNGQLSLKETMAICMIEPSHVACTPFAKSHLLAKLRKALIVVRVVGSTYSDPTYIHRIISFDLSAGLYQAIENDYKLVQQCILDPARGFKALTGEMGAYVQPRTKGAGHGSTSRAFYARKELLRLLIPGIQ